VITTTGSLNRINRSLLETEAAAFADRVTDLPAPRVAVNIGGDTREYTVGRNRAEEIARALGDLADRHGRGLMVTTSRRTGPDLSAALAPLGDRGDTTLWTGAGANPYLGFLGLAETIIVTSDSINMVSEACSTGKPVYVLPLGPEPKRRAAFLEAVRAKGFTRPFDGALETWSYPPLRETERVAEALMAQLKASGTLP
jgi:mitochondrial fission protein ELM1